MCERRASLRERDPQDRVSVLRGGGVRAPTAVIVACVDVYEYRFGVEPMCRVLRGHSIAIAPSAYYACMTRPPSARNCSDAVLLPGLKRAPELIYSH